MQEVSVEIVSALYERMLHPPCNILKPVEYYILAKNALLYKLNYKSNILRIQSDREYYATLAPMIANDILLR